MGERLQVHPTSVTSIVDRLEADRLVVRRRHPEDGRAVLAEITAEGRASSSRPPPPSSTPTSASVPWTRRSWASSPAAAPGARSSRRLLSRLDADQLPSGSAIVVCDTARLGDLVPLGGAQRGQPGDLGVDMLPSDVEVEVPLVLARRPVGDVLEQDPALASTRGVHVVGMHHARRGGERPAAVTSRCPGRGRPSRRRAPPRRGRSGPRAGSRGQRPRTSPARWVLAVDRHLEPHRCGRPARLGVDLVEVGQVLLAHQGAPSVRSWRRRGRGRWPCRRRGGCSSWVFHLALSISGSCESSPSGKELRRHRLEVLVSRLGRACSRQASTSASHGVDLLAGALRPGGGSARLQRVVPPVAPVGSQRPRAHRGGSRSTSSERTVAAGCRRRHSSSVTAASRRSRHHLAWLAHSASKARSWSGRSPKSWTRGGHLERRRMTGDLDEAPTGGRSTRTSYDLGMVPSKLDPHDGIGVRSAVAGSGGRSGTRACSRSRDADFTTLSGHRGRAGLRPDRGRAPERSVAGGVPVHPRPLPDRATAAAPGRSGSSPASATPSRPTSATR